MRLTRIKDDVSAITLELLRKNGLLVKFKVKTYYEGYNGQQTYYHNEYVYNSSNKKQINVTIVPKSYIQINVGKEDEKNLFFMSEMFKNRFIKKLSQVVALLEAYDMNEIDIIKVDSAGTRISNNLPKSVRVSMGKSIIGIDIIIREDKADVGVVLTFNESQIIISMYDFLEFYYKLKELNYTSTAIQLLTYMGAPELGEHETDFRPDVPIVNDEYKDPADMVIGNRRDSIGNLTSIETPRKMTPTNNRLKW